MLLPCTSLCGKNEREKGYASDAFVLYSLGSWSIRLSTSRKYWSLLITQWEPVGIVCYKLSFHLYWANYFCLGYLGQGSSLLLLRVGICEQVNSMSQSVVEHPAKPSSLCLHVKKRPIRCTWSFGELKKKWCCFLVWHGGGGCWINGTLLNTM